MSEAVVEDGAACRPNISHAGVVMRRRFGAAAASVSAVVVGGLVATHARWPWSFVVFVPASLGALSFLQASRKTCVARAAEGTFEHEDFSRTPAAEEDVRRSRGIAAGIKRDAVLIGIVAVAVTMLATRLASGA